MGHEMREFRLIAGIGPGGRDIAGLHGQINLFSLSAHDVFDGPDEFGEFEDYTKVSLTYFADGVLADECGEIVDDVEEIIGDGLDHFGEYEDDSVFVRSDAKRCDYEILKDLRDFSDFKKKNFPPNNDEEV